LVARQACIQEICAPGRVEELFRAAGSGRGRRAGQAAWILLFYALWHRRHMQGLASAGGVFDALAG
jgi:asparagine synthase (glutamine-hydrolysing)